MGTRGGAGQSRAGHGRLDGVSGEGLGGEVTSVWVERLDGRGRGNGDCEAWRMRRKLI